MIIQVLYSEYGWDFQKQLIDFDRLLTSKVLAPKPIWGGGGRGAC